MNVVNEVRRLFLTASPAALSGGCREFLPKATLKSGDGREVFLTGFFHSCPARVSRESHRAWRWYTRSIKRATRLAMPEVAPGLERFEA
jgi:hypothetical protein